MIEQTTLLNGIRIVSLKIKERDSVALGFMIGSGGRYEPDRIKGAAHFLEHILFKGSRQYSCDQIKELIEGVGGSLNAFTSEEKTCYYAKIPAPHWNMTHRVLSDMIRSPLITAKDVDKERSVIMEEAKMYHDLPHYYVLELLDGLLWPGHPLGKTLIGNKESLTAITQRELRVFSRQHYVGHNLVVAACGKIDHQALVRVTKKSLGTLSDHHRDECLPVSEKNPHSQTSYDIRPIEQMHLAMGCLAYPVAHPDRHTLNIMNIILGGNMSSRLFNEVREKRGLAYSIATSVKYLKDTGVFLVRAGVDNHKLIDAVKVIRKEFNRIRKSGITDGELKRAKDYYIGQLQLGLEDTLEHMLWLADSLMSLGYQRRLKQIVLAVRKIRKKDVQRVACEILHASNLHLAVVGPLNDAQCRQLDRSVNSKNSQKRNEREIGSSVL